MTALMQLIFNYLCLRNEVQDVQDDAFLMHASCGYHSKENKSCYFWSLGFLFLWMTTTTYVSINAVLFLNLNTILVISSMYACSALGSATGE